MDAKAWNAVIDAAHAATEKHGIPVRGGKKYAQVTTRVELFRRNFIGWGIETEAMKIGEGKGASVIVKATVTDENGAVKATGHASETVGNGQVNSTSALENAETSAIGRALSCLGLHGGEYASLNEMEGVERKREAQKPDYRDELANEPAPQLPEHDVETEYAVKLDSAQSEAVLNDAAKRIKADDRLDDAARYRLRARYRENVDRLRQLAKDFSGEDAA